METQLKTPPAKEDRRAVRSKRLIIEALRALLLEKEYKQISVKDIVERADIGRATFYAHFEDKEDLGRYFFGQLMQQLEDEIQKGLAESEETDIAQELVPSLALFRISEEKYAWFKQNVSRPGGGLTMMQKPLVARLEAKLDELAVPENDEIPRPHAGTFLVSALLALVSKWIQEDMPATPEEMDRIFQSLAAPTLARLLGA
jgi:AcrR family transcriptional regulator